MPMNTVTTGTSTVAADDHNSIVNTLKGNQGEVLTVFYKGSDIASAGAVTIPNQGNFFDITGTTTITSFSTHPAGTVVKFQFDSAVTLTHNATSLILSGGSNYTTSGGDVFEFISLGSGNWMETHRSAAAISIGLRGTPSLTLGTTNAEGSGSAFVSRNATIALFDTSNAAAMSLGSAGTVGAIAFAARRDHVHPFTAIPAVTGSVNNTLSVASTNGTLLWVPPFGIQIVPSTGNILSVASTNGNVAWAAGGTSAHGAASHTDRTRMKFLSAKEMEQESGGAATLFSGGTNVYRVAWLLDAATTERIAFGLVVPSDYASGNITIKPWYCMTSATSGNVVLRLIALSSADGVSVDVAAEVNVSDTVAVPGTAEFIDVHTFSGTLAVAANDYITGDVGRLGGDAGDTATGDFELLGIEFSYTADM